VNPAFESRRPTDLGWAIDCTATAACIRVLQGWGNLAGPRGGLLTARKLYMDGQDEQDRETILLASRAEQPGGGGYLDGQDEK
jgi:hypothetical protein